MNKGYFAYLGKLNVISDKGSIKKRENVRNVDKILNIEYIIEEMLALKDKLEEQKKNNFIERSKKLLVVLGSTIASEFLMLLNPLITFIFYSGLVVPYALYYYNIYHKEAVIIDNELSYVNWQVDTYNNRLEEEDAKREDVESTKPYVSLDRTEERIKSEELKESLQWIRLYSMYPNKTYNELLKIKNNNDYSRIRKMAP